MENEKYYTPIKRLYDMCCAIPCNCEFSIRPLDYGGYQLFCTKDGSVEWDAICGRGTYGGEDSLVETMGLVDNPYDDVTGYQSPLEVFHIFLNKYYEP